MKYCKNCGGELPEGARFCDRCGWSVRAQISKEQEAEKRKQLEEEQKQEEREIRERLDREYERSLKWVDDRIQKKNEERQRQKKKRRRLPIIAVCAGVVLLAVMSAGAAYVITSDNLDRSWLTTDGAVALNSTQSPLPESTAAPQATQSGEKSEYELRMEQIFRAYQDAQNGFTCVYPSDFLHKDNKDPAVKLLVSDGGATLRVTVQGIANADCKVMMMQYAKEIGGDIIQSRADSNGYILQSRTDSRMYFRKLISTGANVLYVDFEYSERAKDAAEYAEYIQYIGDKFQRL